MAVPIAVAAPKIAPWLAKLAPQLGQALPYLAMGLFGRKQQKAQLAPEDAELAMLRAQLSRQNIARSAAMDPLFKAVVSGVFQALPEYARKGMAAPSFGRAPLYRPNTQFKTQPSMEGAGGSYEVRNGRVERKR